MYFAAAQTKINAPFAVKQAGHITQEEKIWSFRDDLYARLLYLEDENLAWLHISADNLGFDFSVQQTIEAQLGSYFEKKKQFCPCSEKKLHVTVSCTHSHHCCDPEDASYVRYFTDTVVEAAKNLKIREMGELTVSYQTESFDKLGKSRISHHTSESVQVDLIRIWQGEKAVADIVIHNVHPTTLYANEPYFSAEYPGYLMRSLKQEEPDVFHTFMQGAAGDNSTRFTRSAQDYAAMEERAELLCQQVRKMKQQTVSRSPMQLSMDKRIIALSHTFEPIDMGNMPSDLSEREKLTIGYGQIMRKRLEDAPEKLKKEVLLSCVDLGGVRIIFAPNEMFSWWRTQMDDSFCALVCYSNGEAPYMTGPGQYLLTYETFTDTVTDASKEKIVDLIRHWGTKN